MGLGQYDSLGEYCVPHTASFMFLILISMYLSVIHGMYKYTFSLRTNEPGEDSKMSKIRK